ncbi:MAG TPA: S46 family peptidase [Bacteroidia bacterium]|nr:S46 family peptidase [Bacteroidia bacterium]
MRKFILYLFIGFTSLLSADEGMWLPQLLQATGVYQKMKQAGCKLTPEQIYSVNKSSLKDAIVLFGGGCTGEIISEKGLMITNHHCGYSSVVNLSTVEKNYLKNGYWAKNQNEELYCPNLSVSIVVRIEDVTAQIQKMIKGITDKKQKEEVLNNTIKNIVNTAIAGTHYNAVVKPFNYELQYFLIVYETFKDIRLVAAPPEHIGKFGGEDDNWMWPRHNADFTMFRIYASKDNKPAEFSPENVPYKPKYVIPISLKGYKENDFTMVYGFPGRTQEYLTSYAVDAIINDIDPRRVNLREKKLSILEKYMKQSAELNLKYANTYASVANYYKKWKGEMIGLKKFNAVDKKRNFENELAQKLKNKPSALDSFNNVMKNFSELYPKYRHIMKLVDYFQECFMAIDAIKYIGYYVDFFTEYNRMKMGMSNQFDKLKQQLSKNIPYQFHLSADKELFIELMSDYFNNVDEKDRIAFLDSLYKQFNKDVVKMADYLYSNSWFLKPEKLTELLNSSSDEKIKDFESDMFYRVSQSIKLNYYAQLLPVMKELESEINEHQKTYLQLMMNYLKEKNFYPDANSTLRIAFGKVKKYEPRDGVRYDYFTTSKGILEKQNNNNPDYYVDDTLRTLFEKKNFGRYADKDGELHIAFIASNHTTGGNSGSPVFNANGELIGTNFDRCWEGTMSDIMYNPDICRNIILDVRYTLFLLDKYAHCNWLIQEMKIVQ